MNRKICNIPLVLYTVLLICSANVHASLILQTATGDIDPAQGYSAVGISNDAYVMHKFQLTETTNIGSVGGFFSITGSVNLFAALISLDSEFDMPNSIDLSTDDVIDTTTFDLQEGLNYSMTDFSITLQTGWYSLAFGAGKFDAGDVVEFSGTNASMVNLPTDLDSSFPISALQPTFWGTKNEFVFQAANAAFVISSNSSDDALRSLTVQIHEPYVLGLFIVFVIALLRIHQPQ